MYFSSWRSNISFTPARTPYCQLIPGHFCFTSYKDIHGLSQGPLSSRGELRSFGMGNKGSRTILLWIHGQSNKTFPAIIKRSLMAREKWEFSRCVSLWETYTKRNMTNAGFLLFQRDLFKFSKTLGLAISFKNSKTFLVLGYILTSNGSTDTNSRVQQKSMPFALLNYSSLFYIVLALSSAVT